LALLRGYFFESEMGSICSILGVLHSDCADISINIQVDNGIFIEVNRTGFSGHRFV